MTSSKVSMNSVAAPTTAKTTVAVTNPAMKLPTADHRLHAFDGEHDDDTDRANRVERDGDRDDRRVEEDVITGPCGRRGRVPAAGGHDATPGMGMSLPDLNRHWARHPTFARASAQLAAQRSPAHSA